MSAIAERYEDDLAFWAALRADLRGYLASPELNLPPTATSRLRQPYDLPTRPLDVQRVQRRTSETVDSEARVMARFRIEARRLARSDADVAALVDAYEEGAEDGADPEMVAIIADLDQARYAAAMHRRATLLDAVAGAWLD